MTKEQNARLDAVVDSLRTRLKAVCAQWPPDVFEAMVKQLAEITVKYESPIATHYDRRTTDRLITEMRELLQRSQVNRADQPPPEGER